MFYKRISCFLIAIWLLMPATIAQATVIADESQMGSGVVSINYELLKDVHYKVMVNKEGVSYSYDLTEDTIVPLQMGNGKYSIFILKQVSGNAYKMVKNEVFEAKLIGENNAYLQSMQLVNWNHDMEVIKKAKELTIDAKNDQEKIKAIYDYVVNNMTYDYQKFSGLSSDYIPCIEEISKAGKGICYDFAVLTAAMLRSVNVPTKLIMGYKKGMNQYHAWNQAYVEDIDEWITIDTTLDSGRARYSDSNKIQKDSTLYTVSAEY